MSPRSLAAGLALALIASTAHAAPKKPPPPDKYTRAAGEAFSQALAADNANDLATAQGLYEKAFEISPHPSTVYNLADVYRRRSYTLQAIEMFQVYLLIAPTADDAKDVEALITKLRTTEVVLSIQTPSGDRKNAVDLGRAYVMIGGKIVKTAREPAATHPTTQAPTIDVPAPNRDLDLDVVTSITYARTACKRGLYFVKFECFVSAPPRIDGNVVVASSETDIRILDRTGKKLTARVKLPPGKQTITVWDLDKECARLTVDVPTNDDVLYVFFDVEPTRYPERCRRVGITQQRLKF